MHHGREKVINPMEKFKTVLLDFRNKITPIKKRNKDKTDYFNFDLIEVYFKKKTHPSSFQVINDRIINDMDLLEVFMLIDMTHSKIGQQYFYNQILDINKKIDFTQQEQLIDFFNANETDLLSVQSLLSKLNKREVYYICNLFLDEYIPKPKWFWMMQVLSLAGFVAAGACIFFTSGYTILFFLLIYITNMVIHFRNKKNIMVYMESIPQLPLLSRIARELASMNFMHDSKTSVLHSVASINEMRPIIRFFKLDTNIKSEIEALILLIWEAIKILLLIEPLVIFNTFKRLENKKNDIRNLFEYTGKIDSAISIAAMRKNNPNFCKPLLINTNQGLSFTDLYHPLIPDCVTNSLAIKNKSILLTGSNMSGKTTFIRTIAINVLLGQTINTCFAHTFQFAQSHVYSAIRVSDDLANDKSYYFEEVTIVKDMIINSLSTENHIFFLDEIFKGTNTVERIAAGKAILSFLAKSSNNLVFVSTHDIELADLLSGEYDLYHFTESIEGDTIHFDYTLKPGYLYTKNAIRILEINNYPEEIISDAKSQTVKLLDQTHPKGSGVSVRLV